MKELPTSVVRSAWPSTIATAALGGAIGGTLAAALVIGFTEILKAMLAVVSRQHTWILILVPLVGLTLTVLALYKFGLSSDTEPSERRRWAAAWRMFAPRSSRSDLTGDMVGF